MRARLEWNEAAERSVASVDGLDRALDELSTGASGASFLVELVREDGASLSLGLGRSLTVLDYVPPDLDPPYFQSVGDEGGESLWFRFRGDLSEFPSNAAVPVELGRRALRHFFQTGELSPELAWRET